ncbi:membrane-bound lytic murein transglycosylase MltF [Aliiglaciecola sp. CAU 1673]|uniref:membrane-bound lytic murein transglycosylase MltF n=1 Tax=Aliiglaciecola sp. CAU 1673 TaxID=3032595 RepID=UPI0023DA657F|nr:membrane-bound lytic murein transglycosylase MltF [Aliiglaciecola sp. CAU 1673]MDF2178960.1 membrane-bound lytic murein transglycosylase MltF [Aliiglaciecola sp. CAU 1673]
MLSMLWACDSAPKQPKLQQVLDAGVLKVGTLYGPTTYYTGPGGPEGFEYELVKGFAEHLGVQLEVLPYFSLNEAFSHLENQNLDLLAAGLTVTPEREARYRFGPAYQLVSQKLVYKQGHVRPRDIENIDGELMVVSDSSHAATLRTLKGEYADLRWQETKDMDMEELMEAVLDEQYDYTVADSNILAVMQRRYPELAVGFTLHEEQRVAWAMNANADDSLMAAMLDYFGTLYVDGKLAALEDKYYGHVRQFNYVATRLFMRAVDDVLPTYRPWFEQYAGELDWRLLAAMAYQESLWDPMAKSATGVRGLMMLTLATAQDLGVTSRLDPQQSISGGARYLQDLIRRIPDRITYPDRIYFALAAYNIGMGHLEDARVLTQRQGGNPDLWVDVKQRLPLLRQKKHYRTTKYGYARGDEAAAYVANIRRYYDTLVWLDEQKNKPAPAQVPEDLAAEEISDDSINETPPAETDSSQ